MSDRMSHIGLSLLALLFVSLQGFGLAHAVHHGDEPHEHHGVVCVIDAVIAENDVIAPPLAHRSELPRVKTEAWQTDYYVSVIYSGPFGRSPPPRAPPVSH